jgi:hypothetical protein
VAYFSPVVALLVLLLVVCWLLLVLVVVLLWAAELVVAEELLVVRAELAVVVEVVDFLGVLELATVEEDRFEEDFFLWLELLALLDELEELAATFSVFWGRLTALWRAKP